MTTRLDQFSFKTPQPESIYLYPDDSKEHEALLRSNEMISNG